MNTMHNDETINVTVRSIIAAISTFAVVGAIDSSLPGTTLFALLSLVSVFALTIALILPMSIGTTKVTRRTLADQTSRSAVQGA